MRTNKYNTKKEVSRIKFNSLMNNAYNYGKNDGGEVSFKRERDEMWEKTK